MTPALMPSWFGVPELVEHVALFRYLLVGLALVWAAVVARGPRWLGLVVGLVFALAATGFWVLGLARPYGLLVDAAITRRAAEAAVVAASGGAGESFVAGEPLAYRGFVALLNAGLSADLLTVLPSAIPAVAVAAVGLLVFALWPRRHEALTAAFLWLAFATGDLDAVRGLGVVPGIWSHPEEALLIVPLVALGLAVARLPRPWGALLVGSISLACLIGPAPGQSLSLAGAVLLLTLDQGPWLALGAFGLLRTQDTAALGLCLGGATTVMASSVLGSGGGFAGFALFRLGLLLASASALSELFGKAAEALERLAQRLPGVAPERLGLALLLALGVPGSFLVWWDPPRTDPVARASQEPISPAIAPVMSYIRKDSPRHAVFVASPDYAPAVAVFGGRRVLRAPSVLVTADDSRRLRAEGALLSGRPIPPGGADHGARFLLLAPGDFKARGIARPEELEGRPGFLTRYADGAGYRVYEVVR